MYICICNAVTERDICVAAARGAATVDDLTIELGVGAGCGSCRDGAQAVLSECKRGTHCSHRRTHPPDFPPLATSNA